VNSLGNTDGNHDLMLLVFATMQSDNLPAFVEMLSEAQV